MKYDKPKPLITEKVTQNSSAVNDVFLEKFDTTWAADIDKDGPRALTIIPVESLKGVADDGTVAYSYNNEWFRSDNFVKKHPEKHHVLFAGCSESEGVGGNLETVWTKMLHESLNKKHNVGGFYSIARAGFGWQKIITNFTIYVKKYGAPSHLFVLMPNIDRMFDWIEESLTWRYSQKVSAFIDLPTSGVHAKDIPSGPEHMKMLIDFTVSWKLFEEYCESIGTNLLWSTWDTPESSNFLFFKQHKFFFKIDKEAYFENFIKAKRPNGKIEKDDINRRDGHSGKLFHMFWKEEFEKQIDVRGLFDD